MPSLRLTTQSPRCSVLTPPFIYCMIDPTTHIKKIFVEQGVADLAYTREILQRASTIPVEIINGHHLPGLDPNQYPQNLTKGKQNLLLCQNRGHFFKPCPATREYRCCDYQVINIGMNMGIFPITGITLPFVSYGGSSLLASFLGLGLAQNTRK